MQETKKMAEEANRIGQEAHPLGAGSESRP
jgi:hypothetical protein